MWKDEIVEEIHRIRDEYAKSFDYNLDAIFADLQKQQAASGRKLVSLQPKQQSDNKKKRQVIMYRDEDGYWIVECPSLKGCVSQGKTKEEALANIKEAITGYIAALESDGLPVPEYNFETFLV
ncbi:type II toxin-antitoxin system HicB family antitoxin [Floridanema aerugineum]|uniref:Type II toxin-antitoxin system HicB family antitoxin n=1 Tax=Floridaenema aerugineum BLCC-F46 TaxID=3153654 RepID=A0ABV4XB33_9CYAN